MQVRGLPGYLTRNAGAASRLLAAKTPNIEAERRRDAVARWRRAMADGLTAEQAAKAVGVPRPTLYRWKNDAEPKSRRPKRTRQTTWPSALVQAVERLRLDFPWGRAKIGPVLRAEGFTASDATIGRIIQSLVKRGVVDPVPLLRKRQKTRRWTATRRLAQRLPKDLRATEPGSLVQLDTVFVTLAPGKAIKHFTAYDPTAKWTVAKAFNRATARSAALFLDKVVRDMPFPVKAIQVDGGSEFMAEFEHACQAKNIKLYVLPPKSPKINGAVERCNGSWRYEFYSTYELPTKVEELNPFLDSFQHLYNYHRPHGALGGQTPARYLAQRSAKATHSPSHMC
jgi:putative transposase